MKEVIFFFLAIFLAGSGHASEPADTLRVGVYESPPFVIFKNDSELEGVSVWLWEQLVDDLDQPYKIFRYSNEEPLKRILDDLSNGKIDISINPISITGERFESIDFTFPFYIGNLAMAKSSHTKLESLTSTMKAFLNRKVLHMTLILFGFIVVFGFIIWRVENKNKHFGEGIHGLLTGFWWSAVTMTTVGYGDTVPKSHVGRLIAFIWMLFSLIIISIFVASMTSILTVRNLTDANLTPESFKQARVATVDASATEDYLRRNFFRDIVLYPNLEEGLTALREHEVDIFVYDEPWLAYQINQNPAFKKLEILPMRFQMEQYAMPMRKLLDKDLEHWFAEAMLLSIESREWLAVLDEYQLEKL